MKKCYYDNNINYEVMKMSTTATNSNNTKTTLNIKIDKNVKERAAQMLESMGLDHTTAIDMYYRKIIAEMKLPFQPEPMPTLEDQITKLIKEKNIPIVKLEADENGHLIIDKDKHPDLYDWAVNG